MPQTVAQLRTPKKTCSRWILSLELMSSLICLYRRIGCELLNGIGFSWTTAPCFVLFNFLIFIFKKSFSCFHSRKKEMWLHGSVYFKSIHVLWFLMVFFGFFIHEEKCVHLHAHNKKVSIEHKKKKILVPPQETLQVQKIEIKSFHILKFHCAFILLDILL